MGRKKKEVVKLSAKEIFTQWDETNLENIQIREVLTQLLEANKDNQALMEFNELMNKLNENQAVMDKCKKDLYEPMLEEKQKEFKGKSICVTLKMPYIKNEFDKERFIEEYGEETYNKFMVEKEVKGNCQAKPNETITISNITVQDIITKIRTKKEEA